MNTQTLQIFFTESRNCAIAMLEAATHMQRELPNVRMPDAQRERTLEVCSKLIEAKHDVIHKLFELSSAANSSEPEAQISKAIESTLGWMIEGIQEIRGLADELQSAAVEDPGLHLAFILVAENFMNITTQFERAHQAADSLERGTNNS